jgi:membrane protein
MVYCGRQLVHHRAEGMAAELTYRTIFSLIPVVVLALVMFRVVGGLDDVQANVENRLYSFFGVPNIPSDYLHEEAEEVKQESRRSEKESKDKIKKTLAGDGETDHSPPLVSHPPLESPAEPDDGIVPDYSGRPRPDENIDEALVEAIDDKADDAATTMEARASIRRTLREATSQIASLNFASIGVVGLMLFLYAAVALANSTEYLFNIIY